MGGSGRSSCGGSDRSSCGGSGRSSGRGGQSGGGRIDRRGSSSGGGLGTCCRYFRNNDKLPRYAGCGYGGSRSSSWTSLQIPRLYQGELEIDTFILSMIIRVKSNLREWNVPS